MWAKTFSYIFKCSEIFTGTKGSQHHLKFTQFAGILNEIRTEVSCLIMINTFFSHKTLLQQNDKDFEHNFVHNFTPQIGKMSTYSFKNQGWLICWFDLWPENNNYFLLIDQTNK